VLLVEIFEVLLKVTLLNRNTVTVNELNKLNKCFTL